MKRSHANLWLIYNGSKNLPPYDFTPRQETVGDFLPPERHLHLVSVDGTPRDKPELTPTFSQNAGMCPLITAGFGLTIAWLDLFSTLLRTGTPRGLFSGHYNRPESEP